MLDDGSAGLAEIKRRGGVAVVQDPATATFPSMPLHAIRDVDVDHVVGLSEMPALLARLAQNDHPGGMEVAEAMTSMDTKLTCPECRGPLEEERQGRIVEFRCRVGHVFSKLGLAHYHNGTLERSVWAAIVALEEGADICEKLSESEDAIAEAQLRREEAARLRRALERLKHRN